MSNNDKMSYAKITVEEVENGQIKSFSITNSESSGVAKTIPEKQIENTGDLVVADTIYIDLNHLDKFNEECNLVLLHNDQIKRFMEKKE